MLIDEKLINYEIINYLEDLSFITLSGEERDRICADLKNIIAGMDMLSTLDTSGVSAQAFPANSKTNKFGTNKFGTNTFVPNETVTELRKDEVVPSFPRSEILKNAPKANGETFVVPKTVE